MNIKNTISALKHFGRLNRRVSGRAHMMDLFFSRMILRMPYEFYLECAMYDRSFAEKSKYLYDSYKYMCPLNGVDSPSASTDKFDIGKKIEPYLKRGMMRTKGLGYEAFRSFVNGGGKTLFYKPLEGSLGKGIEKIQVDGADEADMRRVYGYIAGLPDGLVEEAIVQHKDMDRLNPHVLQTIRLMVFKRRDGKARLLFCALRTSRRADVVVDNAGMGGLFVNVDLQTGRIDTNGFAEVCGGIKMEDMTDEFVESITTGVELHPITGVRFIGFQIPCFEEAKRMVMEMTEKVDFFGRRMLGYDIAISPDGPVCVEVNCNNPGVSNLWQCTHRDTPLRPVLEQIIKED